MISENILGLVQRIKASGGDPGNTVLVAVTKGRDTSQIRQAIEAGITDIGENRVQEALEKYNQLRSFFNERRTSAKPSAASPKGTNDKRRVNWHFIGRLQTNKVKEAVRIFDLIQSVDSLRLAQEIDRQAGRINKTQDVLIEVKTSSEETKSGIKPEDAPQLITEMLQLKNISIKGLMTIAPVVSDPESARPYFRQLRELRDMLNERRTSAKRSAASPKGTNDEIRILSMGMSDDFEAAVMEGATMLRIGRAIFD